MGVAYHGDKGNKGNQGKKGEPGRFYEQRDNMLEMCCNYDRGDNMSKLCRTLFIAIIIKFFFLCFIHRKLGANVNKWGVIHAFLYHNFWLKNSSPYGTPTRIAPIKHDTNKLQAKEGASKNSPHCK